MTTRAAPKSQFATVNSLKLHFYEWGKTGASVVVLVHGYESPAIYWQDVAEALEDRYHVYAMDQRGRALSDWATDGNYGTDAYVDDLVGLMDSWRVPKAVMVGHSMGGRNVLRFAARRPERTLGMVMVDSAAEGNPAGGGEVRQRIASTPDTFASWEAARAYLEERHGARGPAAVARRLSVMLKEQDGKVVWRADQRLRDAMRSATPRPNPLNAWDDVAKVTCPVLLLVGAESNVVNMDAVRRMQRTMPNTKVVSAPRAGHQVHEDNPADAIRALREFVDGLKLG